MGDAKPLISEQDGKSEVLVNDIDPVSYLKGKLGYKVEDTRKLIGFTTLYNGSSPDTSKVVISIYHPLDAKSNYYISVNKNGSEKKFDGGSQGFGKKLFDDVINYVKY